MLRARWFPMVLVALLARSGVAAETWVFEEYRSDPSPLRAPCDGGRFVVSEGGDRVVVWRDGQIVILDASLQRTLANWEHPVAFVQGLFLEEGRKLVFHDTKGALVCRDLQESKTLWSVDVGEVRSLAASPGGTDLLLAADKGLIWVRSKDGALYRDESVSCDRALFVDGTVYAAVTTEQVAFHTVGDQSGVPIRTQKIVKPCAVAEPPVLRTSGGVLVLARDGLRLFTPTKKSRRLLKSGSSFSFGTQRTRLLACRGGALAVGEKKGWNVTRVSSGSKWSAADSQRLELPGGAKEFTDVAADPTGKAVFLIAKGSVWKVKLGKRIIRSTPPPVLKYSTLQGIPRWRRDGSLDYVRMEKDGFRLMRWDPLDNTRRRLARVAQPVKLWDGQYIFYVEKGGLVLLDRETLERTRCRLPEGVNARRVLAGMTGTSAFLELSEWKQWTRLTSEDVVPLGPKYRHVSLVRLATGEVARTWQEKGTRGVVRADGRVFFLFDYPELPRWMSCEDSDGKELWRVDLDLEQDRSSGPLQLSADGARLLVSGSLYDSETGARVADLTRGDPRVLVRFCVGARWIVVFGPSGVSLHRTANAEYVADVEGIDHVFGQLRHLEISPTGEHLWVRLGSPDLKILRRRALKKD